MEGENDSIELLVKSEILDKNYDKDKFLEFCSIKKENGNDLSNWTKDELQEVIYEFIKVSNEQKDNQNQENKEITKEENESKYSQNNENEKEQKEEDVKIENKNEIKKEELDQLIESADTLTEKHSKITIIKCKKQEKSPLNDKQVKVIIKNPKPVETGFLSSNYVNYEVETGVMDWLVRRRYSDFTWLRETMMKYHPGRLIPLLPNKKLGSRRFEVDFIEKRMKFLQKFIDEVMKDEEFKAAEPINAFLSLSDRNQFEAKMKELTSFQPSPYIDEYRTLSGTLTIASTEEEDSEKYFINIANYYKIQGQILERLNFNLKQYYTNIYNACNNLEDIFQDFETIHKLNTRVLMKEQITRTYEELSIFFKDWKAMLTKQNESFKIHFKDFFKFVRMEGNSYQEIVHKRENCKNKYLNEKNRLEQKKEKLWTQMDISKWEITDDFNDVDKGLLVKDKNYAFSKMCTKETLFLENLNKLLGYANKVNIDELKAIIIKNCKNFISNLKDFSEELYPSLTDGINIYSNIQMFLTTCTFKPKQ